MQVNGMKLPIHAALIVATNLIGWGITIGVILTRLDAVEKSIAELVPRKEVVSMVDKSRLEHIIEWHTPKAVAGTKEKK